MENLYCTFAPCKNPAKYICECNLAQFCKIHIPEHKKLSTQPHSIEPLFYTPNPETKVTLIKEIINNRAKLNENEAKFLKSASCMISNIEDWIKTILIDTEYYFDKSLTEIKETKKICRFEKKPILKLLTLESNEAIKSLRLLFQPELEFKQTKYSEIIKKIEEETEYFRKCRRSYDSFLIESSNIKKQYIDSIILEKQFGGQIPQEMRQPQQGNFPQQVILPSQGNCASPSKDNIYKQLISHMSTVIFTCLPNYYDEILLKLLNEGAAADSSLDTNDYVRLKANLKRLRPAEPAQARVKQCDHKVLLYTPLCGNEHCAYCLKELLDQAKAKNTTVTCEHGRRISPKNIKDLENLLKTVQVGGESPGLPKEEKMQPGGQIPPQIRQPQQGNISQQGNFPPQGNYVPQTQNIPKGTMQQKSQAYTQPVDSDSDEEVTISISIEDPRINPNMQPGLQSQFGTGNVSGNYPQPGMRNPANQSQFAPNPGPQNRNPGPAMNQPQYQQPQNQQRDPMPPYQGIPQVPPAPPLVPKNAPIPAEIECYQCQKFKGVDDFSINCPQHKTCNICRIQDLTQCINCSRGYSPNEISTLTAIRDSL